MTWPKKKLEDVCSSIKAGGTPSRKNQAYWKNGTISWVKIADMKNKYVDRTGEAITKEGLEGSSAKLLPPGTILYSIFATLGSISILDIEAATNQAIAGLTPNENIVTKEYLYYCLIAEREAVIQKKSHNTQDNINLTILREHEIPVPPLDTQKKIVAILERAEKLKEKRAQTNQYTKDIIQSLFYEMFGDPRSNNKGWEKTTLGDSCDVIMGQSPSGESYNVRGEGTPFFQGKAEFGKKHPSVKKWTTSPTKMAKPRDTLISVRAPVGTANQSNIDCCIGRGLAAIRAGGKLNEEYLYRYMELSEKVLEAKGTGSTFKAISGKDLKTFDIMVPPKDLQEEYAKKILILESITKKQDASTEQTNTLFDALMAKAFKGELVV